MVLRALVAFVALPGIVGFALPLTWLASRGGLTPKYPLALLVMLAGAIGLLACIRDFLVEGEGTLAPWDPKRVLVRTGLFRYSRNPMYLSVALLLVGWAIVFGSIPLLLYAFVVIIAFHLRVVYGKEPWLRRRYGEEWQRYCRAVPRWVRMPKPGNGA